MTQNEMQAAAKNFAAQWLGKGNEKQETQRFWIELLGEVLGIRNPASYIEFEKRVKLSHTSFIDAYIPETKVLIEQKGIKIDLKKPYEQSDGTLLTPYEQAKRYVNDMKASEKPRWVVTCNFAEFNVYDMENPQNPPEVIFLKDLAKDFYRLEFLVDRKNENIKREEEISLAAGKLVGKMYDALIKEYIPQGENGELTADQARSLNILCVRLVFCFYAEDAGLFATRTAFEDYLRSFNLQNVRLALINLFKALDTKIEQRDRYDTSIAPFPYVNGGLFKDEKIEIPNFTQEIVDVLCDDCAAFNWSEISPTIFGAVFESTLNPETRRKGGMHYTSIENIHKVIDPLFMDSLNEEFEEICGTRKCPGIELAISPMDSRVKHGNDIGNGLSLSVKKNFRCYDMNGNDGENRMSLSGLTRQSRGNNITLSKSQKEKLIAFQKKLGRLTFLDPACGSGNFLTETFISLRRLENKVISLLNKGERVFGFDEFIHVKISQFFGIEINDFAVTVAKTALWIAESQMINETEKIMGQTINFLPLTTNAFIVEGNALRMDWATLKPIDENAMPALPDDGLFAGITAHVDGSAHNYDYIMGNPPFVGKKEQSKKQKEDLTALAKDVKGIGNLDYVVGWYLKAASLIYETKTHCAFVSTNSITQGEQAATFGKLLLQKEISIDFAYRTFKWKNETSDKKNMAAVHCVIIGFSTDKKSKRKTIFLNSEEKITANNINSYLLDAPNVFIESRTKTLNSNIQMIYGSMPIDDGHLILSEEDAKELLKENSENKKFIHQYMGGDELINGKKRYCLWLKDFSPREIKSSKFIKERVELTKKFREQSNRSQTRALADTPWLFGEIRQSNTNMIVVPKVSSENRKYIPIDFVAPEIIINGSALIVPNATMYEFGVLTSDIHNSWMRAVAGRLEMRYQYSSNIVYNNFPWCNATDEQKLKIEQTAQSILNVRIKYPDCSLADLYDETFMPADLRKAHKENDRAVLQAYGFPPDLTESEIVARLFEMYEKLTQKR